MTNSSRRRLGFSLMELLVSLGILAMISVYLTDMLIRQSRAYSVVDHVSEIQQNARAIADLIERDTRATGFMVWEGGSACGLDRVTASDFLFVTDSDSLSFVDNRVKTYELGAPISSGFTGIGSAEDIILESPHPLIPDGSVDPIIVDGDPFYDITVPPDGIPDSDFRPGAGVIVMDRRNPQRGTACGIIPAGPPAPLSPNIILNVDFTLGGAVPGGQPLGFRPPSWPSPEFVIIPAHVYTVNATNQLLRDGRVIAEDVEDLQVAYFVDLDNDGTLDLPQEYLGADAAFPYVPTNTRHERLREIRVSFVVRSRTQDPDFAQAGSGQFQAMENRTAPAQPPDGFRRRAYTATVRVRNVGQRSLGGGA